MLNRISPQNPAWISASSPENAARVQDFIRAAYGWMFGGLALTTAAALWVLFSAPMQQVVLRPGMMLFLIIVEFGLVLILSFRIQRMSPSAAASAFFVFAFLNGLTLSVVFMVYELGSIGQAFLTAAVMFGSMSIYGMVTKRDLTSWGSFFFMGLIGVIVASVINVFLRSTVLEMAVSFIAVIVFTGLTAYDTQKLKTYALYAPPDRVTNFAVIGALALYLDFINLFLALLRLMGGRRE